MEKINLHNTDLQVSPLCLGTGALGESIDEQTGYKILDRFLESGGNFIDTARVYNDWKPGERGRSERILSEWISSRQVADSIVVATKGGHPDWEHPGVSRISKDEILKDIHLSRKVLGLDRLPLYYLHRDDESVPVTTIIDWMNEFIKSGWIASYGVSNWNTDRIADAVRYTKSAGIQGISAIQNGWSLGSAYAKPYPDSSMIVTDDDLIKLHKKTQIPAIPYNAQASGYFSKYITKPESLEDSLFNTPENRVKAENLMKHAEADAQRAMEYTLGFFKKRPFQVIPVIGAKSVSQLDSTLMAFENAVPYPEWNITI